VVCLCSPKWSRCVKPVLLASTGEHRFQNALYGDRRRCWNCFMATYVAPSRRRHQALTSTSFCSLMITHVTCGSPCCPPRMAPPRRSSAFKRQPSGRAARRCWPCALTVAANSPHRTSSSTAPSLGYIDNSRHCTHHNGMVLWSRETSPSLGLCEAC
jgi:hypothetical protein